jgi:hypothetical protein
MTTIIDGTTGLSTTGSGNVVTASGGAIGIGTSTPDAELNILANPQTVSYSITGNSTTAGTDLHISGADGANTRITQDAFGTGSYSAFTGRSGRGTAASPTQTQSADILAQFTGRGFSNGSLQFGNVSTGRLDVVAAGNFTDTSRATNVVIFTTAAAAIDPTAIATFSSASGLSVAGNVTGNNATVSTSLAVGATTPTGTAGQIVATNSITAFYSDKRLKANIIPIGNALDKVDRLSGVTYTQNKFAEQFGYNDYSQQVGVIAQQVQEVLPEVVKLAPFDMGPKGTSLSGENYLTVQYEKIIPLLVEAIKELRAEVKELKGRK